MAAVGELYRRILGDDALRPFFDRIDMETQTAKMVGFLACAFGGPSELRGRPLGQAHASLGLNDEHFDRTVGHLRDSLEALGLEARLVTAVMNSTEALRRQVLG